MSLSENRNYHKDSTHSNNRFRNKANCSGNLRSIDAYYLENYLLLIRVFSGWRIP